MGDREVCSKKRKCQRRKEGRLERRCVIWKEVPVLRDMMRTCRRPGVRLPEFAARFCDLGKPIKLEPMGPASMGFGEIMSK